MRLLLIFCLSVEFISFSQYKLDAPAIDGLFSDELKATFLEQLYQRDEHVKVLGDTLVLMRAENKEEREMIFKRIELADSINYFLVNRYIELYGFTYGSTWSQEAKTALFKVINRSLDTRFRLKHFPILKIAYYEGKLDHNSMVFYLCKTIQDNKQQVDQACVNRDLEKLFKKVKKMYDRYYWWK